MKSMMKRICAGLKNDINSPNLLEICSLELAAQEIMKWVY
jgi:hypothetical protein